MGSHESSRFPPEVASELHRSGVVAVLVIENVDHAIPLARALFAGGIRAIELTLRTSAAIEAIARIRGEVPEMTAGVGTILTPAQVREVRRVGASFGVSPGFNPRVVAEAHSLGLPFAPGVCTPSDIELALEQGCRDLKFFPAEPIGGLRYLKSVAAPFAHLGVRFLPLGGIDEGQLDSYLREPSVLAVGGSWLVPKSCIANQDWLSITARAESAAAIVRRIRGEEPGAER